MSARLEAATGAAGSFEDFRGDFAALAPVMEAAWAESVSPPFLYTEAYLRNCFAYPGSSFFLAPTLYRGSEPVAFVAGFPRTVRLHGRDLRLLVVALLTVAVDCKSRGYGILAWSELVRRGREAGFDGVVNYCVEGEAMNRMIEGSCRRLGLDVVRAFTVEYLSKVLWGKRAAPGGSSSSPAVGMFLERAADTAGRAELARLWTAQEAAWQIGRFDAVGVELRRENAAGIIAGYVMPIANRDRTRCAMIDDVFWGELGSSDRGALVRDLVAAAGSAGASVAVAPVQGYTDLQPFIGAGFRPSNRRVHAYLTVWNGSTPGAPLSSFYLDVF